MATRPTPYDTLQAFDAESGDLNVIIETPKGSRNKFDYEPKLGVFMLAGVLPAGAVFPYDFGFVPATLGGDGDPMDVLVLMDEPAFAGCLVPCRLIGVIEADQTERDGETTRNDRLIAVAASSHNHHDVNTLSDITTNLVDEIEHFFVSYNQAKGKEFKPLKRSGPARARHLVEEGIEQANSGKKAQEKSKAK